MYIRPTLEYGDVIWDGCAQADVALLQGIQLTLAPVVTGANCRTSHVLLYNYIGWETLARHRDKHRLRLL